MAQRKEREGVARSTVEKLETQTKKLETHVKKLKEELESVKSRNLEEYSEYKRIETALREELDILREKKSPKYLAS